MCGTLLRFVHIMSHPEHQDLRVGCVCAGAMEEDYTAARRREADYKSLRAKRSRWLTGWRTSARGNAFRNTRDGFNVVVYATSRGWSARFVERAERLFYWDGRCHQLEPITCVLTAGYRTQDEAKLAAFDAMATFKGDLGARPVEFRTIEPDHAGI
jgi:hypothetical protein